MRYSFLFINNDPARISTSDFTDVVQANLLQQAEDFATAYGLLPSLVSEHPATDPVPASTTDMTFVPCDFRPSNASDPQGAVAYHWVNPETNRIECVVLTDVVASMSGSFVDNLSTSASHEACECREDLFGDEWADLPDGRSEAFETCDRVQNASYGKKVASGRTVQVSNFLFAAAFSLAPLPPGTQVDQMKLLSSDNPRQILPDRGDGKGAGYAAIKSADGSEVQVDGDKAAALKFSQHTMIRRGVDVEKLRAAA